MEQRNVFTLVYLRRLCRRRAAFERNLAIATVPNLHRRRLHGPRARNRRILGALDEYLDRFRALLNLVRTFRNLAKVQRFRVLFQLLRANRSRHLRFFLNRHSSRHFLFLRVFPPLFRLSQHLFLLLLRFFRLLFKLVRDAQFFHLSLQLSLFELDFLHFFLGKLAPLLVIFFRGSIVILVVVFVKGFVFFVFLLFSSSSSFFCLVFFFAHHF
jgi:hypothetical protein